MPLRHVSDISKILYPESHVQKRIVQAFLKLGSGEGIPYGDDNELKRTLEIIKNDGIASKDVIVLENFQGRVVQGCPCTSGALRCGYGVVNTCFGCLYDCTYCFLNSYLNIFGIHQLTDTGRIVEAVREMAASAPGLARIGTGEFTDSLMFDQVTGLAADLIGAVKNLPLVMMEFKTKSSNIEHLLDIREKGSAVLSWSLNTEQVIERYEQDTSSLEERLAAATRAAEAGFYTAFHFDPIVSYVGCVDDYRSVVERLFRRVPAGSVAWISLGCFRFSGNLREPLHDRFPGELLTAGELFPSFDGKFRYLKQKRVALYRNINETITRHGGTVPVYLCMEPAEVWSGVFANTEGGALAAFHHRIMRHLRLDGTVKAV